MSIAPRKARTTVIGPRHHGRRMTLRRFAPAMTEPGYLYELENGVVVVVDVPGVPHERIIQRIRRMLARYEDGNPGIIDLVSGGTGSVVRAWNAQSERHPDLTIYLTPPPEGNEQPWDEWTPDIVIEIVSKSSTRRDYTTKARDYLSAGVRQYWINDPLTRSATLHIRRGDTWRKQRVAASGVVKSALLPGFQMKLAEVLGSQP